MGCLGFDNRIGADKNFEKEVMPWSAAWEISFSAAILDFSKSRFSV
jgi:hypothetical protein